MRDMRYMLAAVIFFAAMPVARAQTDAPALDGFPVCYNFECSRQETVTLDAQQRQAMRALFTPAAASAAEERAMIRRAIAQMEVFAGVLAGTSGELGGNVAGAGRPGQMDCIDESSNTTTYLTLLQQDDLLRWHQVQPRAQRDKWIIDIHWTAVIRDTDSGQLYAVDSWFLDNGQPPYIQRLEDWLDKKDFAEQDGRL
ncbi:MAG: hypothetical protein Q7U07_07245 [Gammaproteobacteria bacterium]|nr:hypothetical protein [Gammaproteobacteria bacterium]